MRVRTRSACVVLAWGILLLLVAVGSKGSFRPAQANIRIASNTSITQVTLASSSTSILTSSPALRSDAAPAPAAARATARLETTDTGTRTAPPTRTPIGARADTGAYVVQPGDTLSGIAAALGTPGGWAALYAANRQIIGPDPNVIRPGTALALPGRNAPARYTVAAGDTLSGIAAALGTPGGWAALYAANQRAIGPDPDVIRVGTVLAIPATAPPAPASAAPRPGRPSPAPAPAPVRTTAPTPTPATAPAPPPASAKAPAPAPAKAPAPAGLPRWLQIVLLAAGVLIAAAFLTELLLALARRRRPAPTPPADPAAPPAASPPASPAASPAACPPAGQPRILLADYDRLVVTSSGPDGMVCVLRPPGADPAVILLAARLVLAQELYEELAGRLGMPAPWRRE